MNTTTTATVPATVDVPAKPEGLVAAMAPAAAIAGRGEVTTRLGKVARLPKALRDEVNRRLDDGEPGNKIVEWLNGEKAVKEVLRRYFEGRAISEQNLSAWRQGGYAEWCLVQEMRERAVLRQEHLGDLEEAGAEWDADRLARVGASALGQLLTDAMLRPAGIEKENSILRIMDAIGRAQGRERAVERGQREAERYVREVADEGARRKKEALEMMDAEKTEMDGYFDDAKNRKAECESAGKEAPAKVRSFLASEPVYRLDYEKRRKKLEQMPAEWFDPVRASGGGQGAAGEGVEVGGVEMGGVGATKAGGGGK